jgi:hypothetical protein
MLFFSFEDSVNSVDKTTMMNGETTDTKKIQGTIIKQNHTSPILHRLLTSPAKSNETSVVINQPDPLDNENNKSPQYRPRFSPFYVPETKNNTKFISKDNSNK